MSKYFTPVEFPELEKEVLITPVLEDKFPVDVTPFIVVFQRLLKAIESGESGICGSISLNKSPVHLALTRFSYFPCKITLINFLNILQQEVNMRAKQEAINTLKNGNKILEEYLKNIGV